MRAMTNAMRPRLTAPSSPAGVIDPKPIKAKIEALGRFGLDELRVLWRNRWGRLAPAHLSRGLLYRVMAYRIQAEAFGDLDRETKRMLDRLADNAPADRSPAGAAMGESSHRGSASVSSPNVGELRLILKPGALLTREWQGRIERVMALEEGFAWNGETYASLSAAAFAITGVKWNGRRFFFGPGDRGRSGGTGRRAKAEIAPALASSFMREATP
jgi:hypothetical protein